MRDVPRPDSSPRQVRQGFVFVPPWSANPKKQRALIPPSTNSPSSRVRGCRARRGVSLAGMRPLVFGKRVRFARLLVPGTPVRAITPARTTTLAMGKPALIHHRQPPRPVPAPRGSDMKEHLCLGLSYTRDTPLPPELWRGTQLTGIAPNPLSSLCARGSGVMLGGVFRCWALRGLPMRATGGDDFAGAGTLSARSDVVPASACLRRKIGFVAWVLWLVVRASYPTPGAGLRIQMWGVFAETDRVLRSTLGVEAPHKRWRSRRAPDQRRGWFLCSWLPRERRV